MQTGGAMDALGGGEFVRGDTQTPRRTPVARGDATKLPNSATSERAAQRSRA
jgi:hypothetical protein